MFLERPEEMSLKRRRGKETVFFLLAPGDDFCSSRRKERSFGGEIESGKRVEEAASFACFSCCLRVFLVVMPVGAACVGIFLLVFFSA